MDELHLDDLKNEIALLKRMLHVLLEQNEALKVQNSRLLQQTGAANVDDSVSSTQNTPEHLTHSPTLEGFDPIQQTDSLSEKGTTPKQEIDSLSELRDITKHLSQPDADIGLGISKPSDSTTQQQHAPIQLSQSNAPTGSGMSKKTEPLPLRLAMEPHNIYPLASVLHSSGFGGWKNHTTEAAAKLLLQFYNELPGDYRHLRHLTGYSEGGLGKLLMNLRQKGYLIKSGFQQHAITGKAYEAMQKAGCK